MARNKVVVPLVYPAQPKITPRKSLSSRLDDCQFCVSTPPSSSSAPKFQIEKSPKHNGQHQDCQECVKQLLPDIKSFTLPRAQSEIIAKVNERHLEPGNSRRTFKNGTLKSDFQWIQMRNLTDPKQSESEKMQNFTEYQIVCLLQNIDDIAKDVLEIKEHIKKLHVGYNEILGVQNGHKQSLNDIQSNMGIISKSLDHLQNAILKSHSPPRYREVDLTSSNFSTASSSNQPQDGIRSLLFKGIENVNIAEFEKISKGILLAREKTDLMKERVKGFPPIESLRLPKNYVSLKTLIENGQPSTPQILAMSGVTSRTPREQTQRESSSKRERTEPFFFQNKGSKNPNDTSAHEAAATSPFSRYRENLQSVNIRFDNPSTKGYGNTLLVNIDCLPHDEVITTLHNLHAWALQRKAETKADWSDVVTQIAWSFTGILKQ